MKIPKFTNQLICCLGCVFALSSPAFSDEQEMVNEIFHSALAQGRSYQLLGELCERFPHRLSGSPESSAANLWVKQVMEQRGMQARLQEVMGAFGEADPERLRLQEQFMNQLIDVDD